MYCHYGIFNVTNVPCAYTQIMSYMVRMRPFFWFFFMHYQTLLIYPKFVPMGEYKMLSTCYLLSSIQNICKHTCLGKHSLCIWELDGILKCLGTTYLLVLFIFELCLKTLHKMHHNTFCDFFFCYAVIFNTQPDYYFESTPTAE